MQHITFDLETTIRNRGEGAVGDFAASPFCKENVVVFSACVYNQDDLVVSHPGIMDFAAEIKRGPVTLIGQNVGFDILYLFKTHYCAILPFLSNLHIWDIQQVEYLLSGQTKMYPSLDEMCIARGLPVKDDAVRAYWDAGVDTDKIPYTILKEYGEHDVRVTQAIYFDQLATLADKPELMELVKVKMDDLLATILMEWNGMRFNFEHAYHLTNESETALKHLEAHLEAQAQLAGWPSEHVQFDPAKNEHVSALLFGGEVKWEQYFPVTDEHGEPVRYKTGARAGQVKEKKETVTSKLLPRPDVPTGFAIPTKKAGVFKVDDEVLSTLASKCEGPVRYFCNNLLDWRRMQKDLSTYYKGYSSLVWPDGLIHPSINHASTRTGRQSCTKPNLQNVTKADEE